MTMNKIEETLEKNFKNVTIYQVEEIQCILTKFFMELCGTFTIVNLDKNVNINNTTDEWFFSVRHRKLGKWECLYLVCVQTIRRTDVMNFCAKVDHIEVE